MKPHPKRKRKRQARIKNRILDWLRAKRRDLTHTHRRVWESRCRRYRVEEMKILLALDTDPYPTYYMAYGLGLTPSQHRTRKAAEDACERHAQDPTIQRRLALAKRRELAAAAEGTKRIDRTLGIRGLDDGEPYDGDGPTDLGTDGATEPTE